MGLPYNKRTHRCGELRGGDVNKTVLLAGWVNSSRDHGGMTFIDLRDHTGLTQLRFRPNEHPAAHAIARDLHGEDVIAVRGQVISRGDKTNPKLPTGEIEVDVTEVEVLSHAAPLPVQIADMGAASEELRLKYRYLDFRRPQMQKIFRMRALMGHTIRSYFHEHGFVEIETPFLGKSTPEGARDYLVPSRVKPGTFYALPQSPQIFKQLFMIGGFDRYAQLVRCFRDEDLRADRQPEFTQLDMEMAFVDREDVMTMVEGCIQRLFKVVLNVDVQTPFPRMTEHEAMERFGIDRPDTRFGLELQNVTEFARRTDFKVFREAIDAGGVVKCIVAKGAEQTLTRSVIDNQLTEEIKGIGGSGLPYTKVSRSASGGREFTTGVAKFLQPMCDELCAHLGADVGDVILFMPGSYDDVCKYLNHLRGRLGQLLKLIPENQWNLLWVIDFPLFIWDKDEQRWFSTHHPFTAPIDEDLHLLDSEPGKVRDKAYDLVLNGIEMAGGSIRIHRQDIQSKVFGLLGISPEEAQEKFSYLLDGLRMGAPPHGGIAFGFDRWAMMFAGADSLRDVIAYPKTQRAYCPMMDTPSAVDEKQLRELHIGVKLPPGEKK